MLREVDVGDSEVSARHGGGPGMHGAQGDAREREMN